MYVFDTVLYCIVANYITRWKIYRTTQTAKNNQNNENENRKRETRTGGRKEKRNEGATVISRSTVDISIVYDRVRLYTAITHKRVLH